MGNDRGRDDWRRIDEARRLSEEERRRVNRDFDEKIRDSTIKSLIAARRAAELSSEIERRKRSEAAKRLLEEMQEKKASVLKQISVCSCVPSDIKEKWYKHLNSIDLMRPDAGAELKDLLKDVEVGRGILLGPLLTPESTEGQSSSLNPFELMLKRKREARALERISYTSDLALIASSLGSLISTRNLYESALSQL